MIQTANRLHTIEEYYFSKKLREVRGLIAQGKPIINMGIGSPDMAPSNEVLTAITDSVHQKGAHQYQSYQGIPELREAIAAFYEDKFGVTVAKDTEILPLMGSKEGIMHISMAFLNEGDIALVPNPGYPTYTSVTKLVGALPKYYNLTDEEGWFPDLEALEEQDLSRVKLMWVNYPHMPTGAKATRKQLESLIHFAKRNSILLVNDNPYAFVLNEAPTSLLSIPDAKTVALELNSLSKTFNMAGWRVGMVLGNEGHISAVLKVKSNMDSGMFYGIQKGAVTALQSSDQWFTALNKVYSERRKHMFVLADLLGCSYDTQAVGMFVWAKLPQGSLKSEAFIDKVLYEHHIFIAPGTIFGSQGEGYIRFSLCVPVEKIKTAIERFNSK